MKSISRKSTITLLLSTFPFLLAHAQGPDTLWTRTYGGVRADMGYSVQQLADGGYIIFCQTWSFGAGESDLYLIRTAPWGDTLWTKTIGGDSAEYVRSGQQTSDSGYVILGSTKSFGAGSWDVYLAKTDANGDTLWTKTYGGVSGERGYSVQQTSDGGYIIAANSAIGYLIKTDAFGDTIWTKSYERLLVCNSVQQTVDQGYIITGETYFSGSGDVYLVKTDSLGDTLWTKTYGGTENDGGYSGHQTLDGGYIVAGVTHSFGVGDADVYLLKIDSLGDMLWSKAYGGADTDCGKLVQQTSNGGYIIVGSTQSFGQGMSDVYLLKTDANGDTLWTKTLGGSFNDHGLSVRVTSDDGYIVAGYTYSFGVGSDDVYLIKTEPDTLGIEEQTVRPIVQNPLGPTILHGPLVLPKDKNCKVFDITGRIVAPDKIKPGIYFVEVDEQIQQKVIKIR